MNDAQRHTPDTVQLWWSIGIATVLAILVPLTWSIEVPVNLKLAQNSAFLRRFMGRTYQMGKYIGFIVGSFVSVALLLLFLFRSFVAIMIYSETWAWDDSYQHVYNGMIWFILPLLAVIIPLQVYLSRKWLAGKLLAGPWNFD